MTASTQTQACRVDGVLGRLGPLGRQRRPQQHCGVVRGERTHCYVGTPVTHHAPSSRPSPSSSTAVSSWSAILFIVKVPVLSQHSMLTGGRECGSGSGRGWATVRDGVAGTTLYALPASSSIDASRATMAPSRDSAWLPSATAVRGGKVSGKAKE